VVFPEDKVNRIDIIISPENFQRMEMTSSKYYDEQRRSYLCVCNGKIQQSHLVARGNQIQGTEYIDRAMMSMSHKYPFRLNFDKFEDDYPEIDNQRFTALTNSYSTTTGMTLHS